MLIIMFIIFLSFLQTFFFLTSTTIQAASIKSLRALEQRALEQKNLIKQKSQKLTYSRITSYNRYIERFNSEIKKIPYSQIFNATNLLIQQNHRYKQLCQNQEPCQFFYYIISPTTTNEPTQKKTNKDIKNNDNNIKTIFIVSGMHGNQYLGPMTLLYGLKHFNFHNWNDCRIIIFPIANPSGFSKNQRVTYPSFIDPNRDFPIQSYKICYQSSSTMIIDHIYRTYSIQLTLGLHNGRSQIGYNWGTVGQFTNSHTKDYVIYKEISQMLRFYGGSNQKIKMQQFKIGTMNQVIYPASGTFDDWAYAASWYPKKTNSQTFTCQYNQYPANMTNGLVFLFQLGPFDVKQILFGSQIGVNIQPKSKSISNGYISRSIRMIKNIFRVVNPQLIFKFTQNKIFFKLEGCKNGEIQNFLFTEIQLQSSKGFFSQQQRIKLNLTNNNMTMTGNLNPFQVNPIILQLNQSLVFEQVVQTIDQNNKKNLSLKKMKKFHDRLFQISYTLTCDKQWQGKGNTNFAKGRRFSRSHQIKLIQQSYNQNNHLQSSQSYSTSTSTKNYYQSQNQALKSFSFTEQNKQNNSTKQSFLQEFQEQDDSNSENNSTFILLFIIGPIILILLCGVFIICRQIRKQIKNQQKKQQIKITSKDKDKHKHKHLNESKNGDNMKINHFIYQKIDQNNQSFTSLPQPQSQRQHQSQSQSYQLQYPQQQSANPSKNYHHHRHNSSNSGNQASIPYNNSQHFSLSQKNNYSDSPSHKHQQHQQQFQQQSYQQQREQNQNSLLRLSTKPLSQYKRND